MAKVFKGFTKSYATKRKERNRDLYILAVD